MAGIYLINKPKNITSYDCIRILKKIFPNTKIGHAGTLDPFATGLLVVLVGQATKLSNYFINDNKTYTGVITFGFSTTTYDYTGEIINQIEDFCLTKDEINYAITNFTGKINQTPPIYSAIKQDGKKLYKYARENKNITIPSREVIIDSFDLLDFINNQLSFRISVSKGTYIRSIAHDLGVKLNVPAHLSSLNRESSGIFKLNNAYELKDIDCDTKPSISLKQYAQTLPKVVVKPYLEQLIANGVILDHRQTDLKELFAVYSEDNKLLAIYMPYKHEYKPLIIIKG